MRITRAQRIALLRAEGLTLDQVSRALGVVPQRVHQIHRKEVERWDRRAEFDERRSTPEDVALETEIMRGRWVQLGKEGRLEARERRWRALYRGTYHSRPLSWRDKK